MEWRKIVAKANIKATFNCEIQKIWNVVTSLNNYEWRSDLSRIEIISDSQFIEYTTDDYPTTFTITKVNPHKEWEFDMENSNMYGHWTGIFTEKNGKTEIDFTEEVFAKKIIMRPFVKAYLKRQQAQYIADLKKVVEI